MGTLRLFFLKYRMAVIYWMYLKKIRDRILELVEDSLMFLFSTKLKPFQVIRVIPENERNPNIVKKYAIYVQVENQFVRYGNT
jgi:hypothetical protein